MLVKPRVVVLFHVPLRLVSMFSFTVCHHPYPEADLSFSTLSRVERPDTYCNALKFNLAVQNGCLKHCVENFRTGGIA